jgi:putative transposase
MMKNHRLAKSIQDAGRAAFLSILTYKAACAGREVIAVNPAFTSQTRSGCGVLVDKDFSVRWRSRPDCGTSRDQPGPAGTSQDQNAAKYRERLGQSRRGAVA